MKDVPLLFLLAYLGCLAVSCRREPASTRALRELQDMEAAYSTGSVQTAENVLLAYLDLLTVLEKRGAKGHDYLFGTAMTHGRLFLLYKSIGETNAMSAHYAQSVEKLTEWKEREGRPAVEFTPAVLAELVEQFDRGMQVQWKAGQTGIQQGGPQHTPANGANESSGTRAGAK